MSSSNLEIGQQGTSPIKGSRFHAYVFVDTASSRMGVLEGTSNTLDEDALRCAESPVQPPLDPEDADAAHHPSVASQHLIGTSAGTDSSSIQLSTVLLADISY